MPGRTYLDKFINVLLEKPRTRQEEYDLDEITPFQLQINNNIIIIIIVIIVIIVVVVVVGVVVVIFRHLLLLTQVILNRVLQ